MAPFSLGAGNWKERGTVTAEHLQHKSGVIADHLLDAHPASAPIPYAAMGQHVENDERDQFRLTALQPTFVDALFENVLKLFEIGSLACLAMANSPSCRLLNSMLPSTASCMCNR